MERQYITKKSNNNSSTNTQKSTLARTAITQIGTNRPLTQQEIENQQYQQDRFEATKLEIQAKYGTITPQGQERLNLLQAKKAEFWQRYLAPVRRSKDFANIPITRTEAESTQQIQAKLTIGAPGDKYEMEADRVATQVVNQIHAPVSVQPPQNLQREEKQEEELQKKSETESIQRVDMPEEELQRSPMLQLQTGDGGMAAPAELESSILQARSGGQPLADNVRKPMERAFGADFSGVKVHTDTQSDQLNQSIQAKAFTTGQDVFFRQGEYQPGSRGGQELIAHELTHVVQQNGGAVQRSPRLPMPLPQPPATVTPSTLESGSGEVVQRTIMIEGTIYRQENKSRFEEKYSEKTRKDILECMQDLVSPNPNSIDDGLNHSRTFVVDVKRDGEEVTVNEVQMSAEVKEVAEGGFSREAAGVPELVFRRPNGYDDIVVSGLISCVGIYIYATDTEDLVKAVCAAHFVTPELIESEKINGKGRNLILEMVNLVRPYGKMSGMLMNANDKRKDVQNAMSEIESVLSTNGVSPTNKMNSGGSVTYRLGSDGTLVKQG